MKVLAKLLVIIIALLVVPCARAESDTKPVCKIGSQHMSALRQMP